MIHSERLGLVENNVSVNKEFDYKYNILFKGIYTDFGKLHNLKIEQYDYLVNMLKKMYISYMRDPDKYSPLFKKGSNGSLEINKLTFSENGEYGGKLFTNVSIYQFKNNLTYRETSIPNFLVYFTFIVNCIENEVFFEKLYRLNIEKSYGKFSPLSKIYDENTFLIGGYNFEAEYETNSLFLLNGNKTMSDLNRIRNESKNMFQLNIDINDYFSSIYTHNFERICENSFFQQKEFTKKDLDFVKSLDRYNMQLNNNETKGILTGPYSSNVCSEILLSSIDFEIIDYIVSEKLDIEYSRFVDDYYFYSNSKENLNNILIKVQNILRNYRLKINETKTIITSDSQMGNSQYQKYKSKVKNLCDIINIDSDDITNLNNDEDKMILFLNEINYYDYIIDIIKEVEKNNSLNNYTASKTLITILKNDFILKSTICEYNEDCYLFLIEFMFKTLIRYPVLSFSIFDLLEALNNKVENEESYTQTFFKTTYQRYLENDYDNTIISYLYFALLRLKKPFTSKSTIKINDLQKMDSFEIAYHLMNGATIKNVQLKEMLTMK